MFAQVRPPACPPAPRGTWHLRGNGADRSSATDDETLTCAVGPRPDADTACSWKMCGRGRARAPRQTGTKHRENSVIQAYLPPQDRRRRIRDLYFTSIIRRTIWALASNVRRRYRAHTGRHAKRGRIDRPGRYRIWICIDKRHRRRGGTRQIVYYPDLWWGFCDAHG